MQIKWSVDVTGTLTGKIDPDDLCGEIMLMHNDLSIRDDLVYLNNWFDCFVNACEGLPQDGIFECDLISEPDPLVFGIRAHVITVSYKSQKVTDIPKSVFCNAVIDAGRRLINRLEVEAPEKERISVKRLESFLRKECGTKD
jgi:hypothetical protein